MPISQTLDQQLASVADQLTTEMNGKLDPAAVRAEVQQVAAELSSAKVTTYVPVLVARAARARLRHRIPA